MSALEMMKTVATDSKNYSDQKQPFSSDRQGKLEAQFGEGAVGQGAEAN